MAIHCSRTSDLFDEEPSYAVPSLPDGLGGVVGIDVETWDPDLASRGPGWFPGGKGHVVGFSLAWGDDGCGYWPLRHQGGGNVEDVDRHLEWLIAQIEENPNVAWVAHNAGYDAGWLGAECRRLHGRELRRPLAGPFHDTWLMSAVLNDVKRNHSLDQLMSEELGTRKEVLLLHAGARRLAVKPSDVKRHLWRLPAPYVARYGEVDAEGTRDLHRVFLRRIEEQGLGGAYDREQRLCPVLVDMRNAGVRVDTDAAERLRGDLGAREKEISAEIKGLVGFGVDVWSAESLKRAFDERGVTDHPRTEKGAPSFTKEWLDGSADRLAALVLDERRTHKLRSTFVEGVILGHSLQGRLHPEVNQVRRDDGGGGTDTGRFSYSNPNLQFLPARRAESAKLIRGLVIPDGEGDKFISADYSQQEPRLTVHYSEKIGARGAAAFAERYRDDPTTDFHSLTAALSGLPRRQAKDLGLAVTYGQGDGTTCERMGFPVEIEEWTGRDGVVRRKKLPGPEGAAVIARFRAEVPFLREVDDAVRAAARRGYVLTLGGRRMRLGATEGVTWASELRKALNKLIQGSAADQTKEAMLLCAEAGLTPKIQIHDELCFSAPPETVGLIRERMEAALPLSVPTVVDVAVGANWGECA